jgi:hypothetical protein
MRNQTKAAKEIPYHLRAPRLRWAVFAVTLEDDELARVEAVAASSATPSQTQMMAQLLLRLHHREDLSKLCLDLHLSRRKLLDLGDRLATPEGRRKLLSQPAVVKGSAQSAILR